ncbi:MAG: ABC transporter substrate-binding protein [Beutenbergiaceae bacterium]
MSRRIRTALSAMGLALTVSLAACATGDPLAEGSGSPTSSAAADTIVVGSQDYYSNEIVAEIYAQVLEGAGYTVDRQFRIGARETYLPEIEAGKIDLFPEYSGPLLQYWMPDTDVRLADPVYAELASSTPDGLRVLAQSEATDQDSYVVTRAFADEWQLTSIADLANVEGTLVMGANSEAETRPNGPMGIKDVYGIDVEFTPIEDGGGPLTVKALQDGDIQFAIIYTADPSIVKNDLVTLEDPEGLFLASHLVPLASDNVDETAAGLIDQVSEIMTAQDLQMLNARSVDEELSAAVIASDWLIDHPIN